MEGRKIDERTSDTIVTFIPFWGYTSIYICFFNLFYTRRYYKFFTTPYIINPYHITQNTKLLYHRMDYSFFYTVVLYIKYDFLHKYIWKRQSANPYIHAICCVPNHYFSITSNIILEHYTFLSYPFYNTNFFFISIFLHPKQFKKPYLSALFYVSYNDYDILITL